MIMLKKALLLLFLAAPAMAEGLPDFTLNALHARDLLDHTPNYEIQAGARDYDLRGAPEPVCARADGRPMKVQPAPVQFLRSYETPGEYSLPGRAGYIQMNSSTRLKLNKEKGELTVDFPDVDFIGGGFGDRADLFIRMTGTEAEPSISWATVLCSGGSYLGYKGSTVSLPRKSSSLSISETLALGSPKVLIARTHHWLTAGMVALEDLCTDDFRARMKDARAETLPARQGPYAFDYNAGKNRLKVKWETK